ncbi:MAG TPA: cytochrome c biogenesis protein ResB [Blastocatellia bacterium]|nr:cytochrome c biogenesis protein ResB [Blastocatellia bacterium]
MAMTKADLAVRAESPADANHSARASEPGESIIDKVLRLLSSVRFGILMLMLLLACCMAGMVIMQQSVDGFDLYYERMAPAQRVLYGMFGLFDIYHSWYFTALLAITGLNIVLSSIDRFPTAWQYIRKPKTSASPNFIRAQMFNATDQARESPESFAERVATAWSKHGLRSRLSRQDGRITVFAQRNTWNRMGAYVVHVALLMILVGGFLTSRYGVGGVMEIVPGTSSNTFATFENDLKGGRSGKAQLPFAVECTDLRQELIRPEGGLDVMNTIDWLSFIRIKEGDRDLPALVHLNAPFDYRGYRFFQSSFQPEGHARRISVVLNPPGGEPREVTIDRGGSVEVDGMGQVSYANFYPDFVLQRGMPETASGDYNNPVAELRITAPDGKTRREYAFNSEMLGQSPHATGPGKNEDQEIGPPPAAGRVLLKSFEKVALSHTLTVQYDPGRAPVYAGFLLLTLSLCAVFFFAHQRVWAVIEPCGNGSRAHFGGNTNRNRPAFEGRFNSLVQSVSGGRTDNE